MKKDRTKLWYLGYVFCAALLLLIAFADFPKGVDAGLACIMGAVFGVSHAELWYAKKMKKDESFEIEVEDERNVQIKYRAGYLVCGVDMLLLDLATAVFIILGYTLPAIITGVMLAAQPVILILASEIIARKI